jgi:hypothetical protein
MKIPVFAFRRGIPATGERQALGERRT